MIENQQLSISSFFLIILTVTVLVLLIDKSKFRVIVCKEVYRKKNSVEVAEVIFEVKKKKRPKILTLSERMYNISIRNVDQYEKESLYENRIELLENRLRIFMKEKVDRAITKVGLGGN